jgi:hypothetical protein
MPSSSSSAMCQAVGMGGGVTMTMARPPPQFPWSFSASSPTALSKQRSLDKTGTSSANMLATPVVCAI